jgi:ComF family protein
VVGRLSAAAARTLDVLSGLAGRRCQLCAAVLDNPRDYPLCAQCASRLTPRRGGYCPLCGTCYADPEAPVYACLSCRMSPPPWAGLAFHGPYEGALKDLVHRHKFGHEHGLVRLLSFLARQAWALRGLSRPDIITPVPMLPAHVLRRGFNQSAELARMLGRDLSLRPLPHVLSKTRETMTQSSLGRAARRGNVAGAFSASPEVRGRHVLVVDDVMTTGATLTACVRACLEAGAGRVDVFVLARAL